MPPKSLYAALLPARFLAERLVTLVTSMLLCNALVISGKLQDEEMQDGGPLPWQLSALSLALLTLVAVQAEPLLSTRLGPRYHTRRADSTGLCAGLLAAPWALAGLAVRQRRQQQHADPAGSSLPAMDLWLPAALAASAAAAGAQAALLLRRQLRELRRSAAAAAAGAPTFPEVAKAEAARRREALGKVWRLGGLLAAAAGACAAACLVSRTRALGLAAAALAPAALRLFHICMRALPRTFTPGEGLLLTQAAVLVAARSVEDHWRLRWRHQPAAYVTGLVPHLLLLSTGCGASLISLLQLAQQLQQEQHEQERRTRGRRAPAPAPSGGPRRGLILASAAVFGATAAVVASPAAYWLLRYALQQRQRLMLLAYWAAVLGASLPAMAWLAACGRLPNIVVRKGYHLLALALFLPPPLLGQALLLAVALACAFAAFAAAEVLRLSGLPRVAEPLHRYLTSFTDSRDSGRILVTHFTLLLGMAAPLWLSNAAAASAGAGLWPAGLAGIMILGFGDTAASVVGRLAGRHPIARGSSKTVEGTAAAVVATMAAWAAVLGCSGGTVAWPGGQEGLWRWAALAGATLLSCLTEALTTQLDNLFVPAHYYALLCLL